MINITSKRSYLIPNKDFKSFFWDYTELTRDKQYKKMVYHDWCDIRKCLEAGHDFLVRFDNDDFVEIINKQRVDKDYSIMHMSEESFGLYLYQSYQNDPCWWKNKYPLVNIVRTNSNDFSDAWDGEYTMSFDLTTLDENVKEMLKTYKNINNSKNTESEKKTMKNFNFDFGPVNNEQVRLSMYGVAVKNLDGVWVSYDKAGNQVMDVDILNFESGNFLYRIPVAIKDIAVGDVVIHAHKPMFVTGIKGSNVEAVDVIAGEAKTILPTKNMFGFDFVTKVVSLVDFGNPNPDNPFGNMLPFLLMSNEDGAVDKNMLMALAFGGGAVGGTDFMANPFLMMALCGNDGDNSNLGLLFAMNAMNSANRPVCQCHCGTEAPAAAKAE